MSNNMAEGTTEIRNMNLALKAELVNLLERTGGWKLLMSTVTVDCDPTKSKKYTADHVKLIEMASTTLQKYCSEIFLDEWGTSGKIRPTLKILMEYLYEINLIRAADCIANKISKDKSALSKKLPEIDDNTNNCSSENFKTTQLIPSSTLKNERLDEITLPYGSLLKATNGFSNKCLIGAGGFGKVFKGMLNNQLVAVKRMDKYAEEKLVEEKDVKQYLNEINIVLKLKHDNLLPLMAISYDIIPCIVYEFMENGSLLDCIACESRSSSLTWKLRIKLGTDVARGLVYLHTAFEKPFIHRDIKTANILLDNQMIAKIGDFGLARNIDHAKTSVIIGTSAYMAPEAFRGDISVKLDVFSFGIVLFELLTGLAPYDESRTSCDLLTYIEDIECPIEDLLDKRAGEWNTNIATKLYNLAICCTAEKIKRPTMHSQDGVLETLENIQSKIND